MWKVLLLLACVAGSTIVFCDDTSNDDCVDTESSFVDASSSSSSSSSSASQTSSTSSNTSTKASSSSKSASSLSFLSASQSYTLSKSSKHSKAQGSDESSTSSDDDASGSGSVDTLGLSPTYKCGPNEVFSNCTNGGCDARNCSQAGKPVACVKLDPKNCKKGCVCAEGYLRTAKGICVLKNQCDEAKCTRLNEYFETCIQGCSNQTCGSIGQVYHCPFQKGCKSGCRCKPGYYRQDIGLPCNLTKEECTIPCERNAHWVKCFLNCGGNQTCDDIGKSWSCPGQVQCQSGCRCNKGYWRDKYGRCIPEKECPQKCGENERWDTCYLNCGVGQDCDDIGKNWTCPKNPKCQIGCRCNVGYWRNKDGVCIPEKQCPTQYCGKNEYFEPCIQDCRNQSCNLLGKPHGSCPGRIVGQCDSGCRCLPNHYRDWTGTCIPENECPRCKQWNENWEHCIQDCSKQTCEEYITGKVNQCPKPGGICPGGSGCRCVSDTYRNATGYCVRKEQCPPICGLNEVYSTCTNGGCSRRYCSQLGKPEICIRRTPESCTTGCVCADGYLRNANGTCVPEKQCPQPGCGGDPNAQPGCGYNCRKKCSNYKSKNPYLCPRLVCKPDKCDCKDGYVLDENLKKCVLPEQCTPISGLNEKYTPCVNGGCGHKNCSQIGTPQVCIGIVAENCIKGCICADGYLRAANGTCVPEKQCPVVTGCGGDPHAESGCGVNCGKTCTTYKAKAPICPRICKVGGCDCIDGYVYDDNVKKCVLPKDCTATCQLNEVYDVCPAPCPPRRCDVDDRVIRCAAPPKPGDAACKPGCRCADGYARLANGTCVLRDQCEQPIPCNYENNELYDSCPPSCPGDSCDVDPALVLCAPKAVVTLLRISQRRTCQLNEVYDVCPAPCPPRRCDVDDRVIRCAAPPQPGDAACKPGCRCADGYARLANGTCVLRDQCEQPLPCNYENYEIYDSCPAGCPGDSCDVDPALVLCAPNPEYGDPRCKPACRCIDGYARNAANKCVPRDQCRTCQINEVYDVCPAPCPPRRCDVDDRVIRCGAAPPQPGDAACKPGCRCADGYARLANGTCVLRDQCEQPLPCNYENYEIYDSCPAGCPGDSCDVDPALVLCARIPEYGDPQCKPACRCIDGYARNAANKCVPRNQCPPKTDEQCPGLNEFYDTCISGCSNQTCDSRGKVIHCPIQPAVCREGCRCKPGFYRNTANVCVAENECPPTTNDQCPGLNEFYDTCISGCSNQTCDSRGKVIHCPIQPAVCREGCRCKPGFYRNSDNVCVAESECPPTSSQCKGQNEYLETCISGCSNQTCDSIGKIINCPLQPAVCRIGCRCKPGFYRNANNVCVAESECPAPPCPDGEVYSRCPTVKCEGDYCQKTRDSPTRCPVGIVCDPPRCVCALGRRRDRKTGKCIQAQDCPPFKCDGRNEEYMSCPATCPSDICSDYVAGKKCPPFFIGIYVPCVPQCRCKKGYYRNNDGVCILASLCGPAITTTNTPVIIEPVTTEEPSTGSGDDGLASLQAGISNFNGRFLYERMRTETGKNLITSPSSVFTPLVQLALYADGDSFKQLASVLNIANKEQIRSSFPAYIASFDGQTSVNFSTAAKVYSNIIYPLSDGFKKDSVDIVHAEAQELDFSKNTEAADTINSWVEGQTNNRIRGLLQPSDLSALTRLVLVNAIYLKGHWHYAFNKTDTVKNADFYLSDGSTKKTELMYQERQFNYGEISELNCTVLQMFYKGDNFSMVVVLPNEKDGIMPVAEKLQEKANFDKVMGSLSSQKVKVFLPPFKIETTTDLTSILKEVGITNIFNASNSGLSGMLKTPENTSVTKAVQKAFIEVNEEGTEAAAANAIVVGVTSVFHPQPPKEIIFRCDHSFLYYIVCNDNVLFAGSLVDRD